MSVNRATLLGHLGRDPEGRSTNGGGRVVTLSLATSEHWRDKNTGDRKEATEWHKVVIFNERLAAVAEQYLRKGSKVYIEGQIKTRKWQDQQGNDRYSTEIVLGQFNAVLDLVDRAARDGAGDGGYAGDSGGSARGYASRRADTPAAGGTAGYGGGAPRSGPGSDLDDDIPF